MFISSPSKSALYLRQHATRNQTHTPRQVPLHAKLNTPPRQRAAQAYVLQLA